MKRNRFNWLYNVRTGWIANIFRVLMGIALFYAGFSHLLWARTEFQAQVPNWVPLPVDLTVVLSGIVEIALGLSLLLLTRWKAGTGLLTAIFFILIFPGNIAQYVNGVDAFGLDSDQARLIRLFFQPVLVIWALFSTGFLEAYKAKINEAKK